MDKTVLHRSSTVFYRTEGPGNTSLPTRANLSAPTRDTEAAIPLLLLHGFAEDGTIWNGQVEYLKKNHPILVPDLPGSGRSSLLSGPTSMEELADAIKAVLDAEGVGQAVLIGHSMGGYIALAFAAKYPERLRACGLFHSTAYPDTEEKKAARRKGIDFIRKSGSAPFIRQSIPNLFSETSRKEHPRMVAGLVNRYSDFNPDSLIHYYEAMIGRPDRTASLIRSAGPVLFIIGEQDSAIPIGSVLPQTHLPSSSDIHILGNAGHMGMLEDSQRSNIILEKFLLRLTSGNSYFCA
jgi:pimeloyl-ACP methyl ester carboxylesterase